MPRAKRIFDRRTKRSLRDVVREYDLPPIAETPYRQNRIDDLWNLTNEGYEPLAWTPNIHYLFYNPKRDILIKDVEGDLTIWKNPSDSLIEREVKKFPKAEVSVGEKFDSRFSKSRRDYNESELRFSIDEEDKELSVDFDKENRDYEEESEMKRVWKPIQEVSEEDIKREDWYIDGIDISRPDIGIRKLVSKYRNRIVVKDDRGREVEIEIHPDDMRGLEIYTYEERIGTDRGEVTSTVKSSEFSATIEHELENVNWKAGDEDVRKAVGRIKEMEWDNPYAKSYAENIEESYVMYGRDGVVTQIRYILSNLDEEEDVEKIEELEWILQGLEE